MLLSNFWDENRGLNHLSEKWSRHQLALVLPTGKPQLYWPLFLTCKVRVTFRIIKQSIMLIIVTPLSVSLGRLCSEQKYIFVKDCGFVVLSIVVRTCCQPQQTITETNRGEEIVIIASERESVTAAFDLGRLRIRLGFYALTRNKDIHVFQRDG